MIMKDGNAVPPILAEALQADSYACKVFEQMRPSGQKRYALHILDAQKEETAKRRVDATMAAIHRYGQRHNL